MYRLSKKELAIVFDFYSPGSGRAKTARLREEVFTDSVLAALQIPLERYQKIRRFNAEETKRIKEFFNISP
jgi:hypothetical protein